MKAKLKEKRMALGLRKKGFSYSEIRKVVPVSKSSLSLWLSETVLRRSQNNRLQKKQITFRQFGAEAKRKQRIDKTRRIKEEAVSEIGQVEIRELFYMGVMLYWAEGSKQRNHISQMVDFSNSDVRMCKLFVRWLREGLNISEDRLVFTIYIHESQREKVNEALNYWSTMVSYPLKNFRRTCFTKTVYPRKKVRKDKGNYFGQLRIGVKRSTDLNRKIAGWVDGICIKCGVQA